MATITEQNDTVLNAIEDIATTATSLTEWSDADTGVTTSGASTDYTDNGRVLAHSSSGMIVGLFALRYSNFDSNNNYFGAGGIRVSLSSDWDTDNSSPSGNTNTHSGDPWSGNVGNNRSSTFSAHSTDYGYTNQGHGVWTQEDPGSQENVATANINYFGCVTSETLNFAGWDDESEGGSAGVFSFEHVSQKFFEDGGAPWAAWSNSTVGDNSGGGGNWQGCAAWAYFEGSCDRGSNGQIYRAQGFDQSEWCMVNPDSNDDTFFFRRPVMYRSSGKGTPVAYLRQIIGNDRNEGGAHGDTIDHNGETYRMFRQSGGSMDVTASAALRYE